MPPLFEESGIIPVDKDITGVTEDVARETITNSLWNRVGEDIISTISEERMLQLDNTIGAITNEKVNELKRNNEIIEKTPKPEPVKKTEPENQVQEIIDPSAEEDYDPNPIVPSPPIEVLPKPKIPTKEALEREQLIKAREDEYMRKIATDYIKKHELFRPNAYYATEKEKERGIVSIGYGSTSLNYDDIKEGFTITEEEALDRLNRDLSMRINEVDKINDALGGKLNYNQRAALVSMLYNVSPESWYKSNARKALLEGNMEEFNVEAFDPQKGFVYGSGERLRGLVRRRKNEQRLFMAEPGQEVEFDEGGYMRKIKDLLTG